MERKKKFEKIQTVLFDMDGVITREDDYWLAAELTVLELLYSSQFIGFRNDVMTTILVKPGMAVSVGKFVSPKVIGELKNSGINTNWDLTFFCAAIYIIELLVDLHGNPLIDRIKTEGITEETLRAIGASHPNPRRDIEHIDTASVFFFQFRKKLDSGRQPVDTHGDFLAGTRRFYSDLNAWLKERAGVSVELFRRGDEFWTLCRALFQERYLGDTLYEQEEGARVSKMYKDGLIFFENTIIPTREIIDTLAMLKEAGMCFGIATGRPYKEIIVPLERWGLLHFFDETRIATYREQLRAEKMLREKGSPEILAKPHPFLYLRALSPELSDEEVLQLSLPVKNHEEVLIVGDSAADVLAAKAMGCRTAVVQTGVKDLNAAHYIKSLEPDFFLKDVSGIKDLF